MMNKQRIATALEKFFVRKHGNDLTSIRPGIGAATATMPLAIGLAASIAIPAAVGYAVLPIQVETYREVANKDNLDIPALEAAIGDRKAILDEIERNEARRSALVTASEAMQRMIDAKSPSSRKYADGVDTDERRESDFEAAKAEFEAAIAAAGLEDHDPAADVTAGGPDTSFRINETEFALDAIEALGGDVETARRQAGLKP
jgi:hypothetical protein